MLTTPKFVPAARFEPEMKERWGLFSVQEDRWLDVLYATEREAFEAAAIIQKARPHRRPDLSTARQG